MAVCQVLITGKFCAELRFFSDCFERFVSVCIHLTSTDIQHRASVFSYLIGWPGAKYRSFKKILLINLLSSNTGHYDMTSLCKLLATRSAVLNHKWLGSHISLLSLYCSIKRIQTSEETSSKVVKCWGYKGVRLWLYEESSSNVGALTWQLIMWNIRSCLFSKEWRSVCDTWKWKYF